MLSRKLLQYVLNTCILRESDELIDRKEQHHESWNLGLCKTTASSAVWAELHNKKESPTVLDHNSMWWTWCVLAACNETHVALAGWSVLRAEGGAELYKKRTIPRVCDMFIHINRDPVDKWWAYSQLQMIQDRFIKKSEVLDLGEQYDSIVVWSMDALKTSRR